MGDLVLGVAKTVVEGTLIRAKSAIDEEAKLKASVERDLVFITGEFQMLQGFLTVTDEERAKNPVVKTWVRQLRDLAYDVEDCIEFVVHLDSKPAWWWRVLPSCMAPERPLDVAVANIKELKERVIDVSQRNMRYNIAGDPGSGSGSKPLLIMPAIAGTKDQFDMLVEARDAAKRQHGLWDLGELVHRPDRGLQVISLWGTTSDLGMKGIIREVYDDPKTCQTFTCRAWVKLMHPFSPQEFLHSLLAQFYKNSCQGGLQGVIGVDVMKKMKSAVTEEDLMDQFVCQVHKHRYLVVLENLSSIVDWDTFNTYLPDMKNGSRIVVSTQQFEIANLCTGRPYRISEIRQLSADHSVCVLFKEGSQHDGDKCQVEVGRDNFLPFESEAAQILDILKGVDSEIRRHNRYLASRVISVWGPAGVGKSALVRSIYRDQMEPKYSHRWGKYAWVNVPRPFELEQFFRSLLWDLCSITTEAEEKERLLALQDSYRAYLECESCCRCILQKHRCLLVIDGLEDMGQWEEINTALELGEAEGRTIIITCEASLAMHCADDANLVCNVKTSEEDASRHLSRDQGSRRDKGKTQAEISHMVAPPPNNNFLLFGRETEEDRIRGTFQLVDEGIMRNNMSFHVMSVWGIAGVGKSYFVRSFYCAQMNLRYSHRWSRQGWVNVPHPFNLREFCRSLLLDMSSKSASGKVDEYFAMSVMEDPIKECLDILREHRCLVVIDDLQSIEDWDSINAALGLRSGKSNTIVITTEASIARHCADGQFFVHNIGSLQPGESFHLYNHQLRLIFRMGDDDMMKQIELTLSKCGGIPKVIIAACRYLAGTITPSWSHYLNDNFIETLRKSLHSDDQSLFIWMHSYFRSCPDLLKPCVFYLPIFPPYYNIRRKRLLRRWIAEGYSRSTVDATAEQNGELCFNQLIDLSMIHWSPQEIQLKFVRMSLCHINGFFQEYIMSQPMEDSMVFSLEKQCSLDSEYTGRHLTIRSSWDRDRIVFESIDFSRLRSLTVFGEWRSFFISNKMQLLRVLDLEDTTSGVSDDDLEQIGKLLTRLKFLSLRGCKSVSRLPTSFGNMKQLGTLDVRHTYISMLPSTITNLQKLQYIRAGSTVPATESSSVRPVSCRLPMFCKTQFMSDHLGVKVPRGIDKLTGLFTLGVVNVGASGGTAFLKELKNLTQLRKLGLSGLNSVHVQDFYAAISSHGHLESLSVHLDKDEKSAFCCVDDIPERLKKTLKSLKLYGLVDKLPVWIGTQLGVIEKMDLEISMLTQDMIDSIGELGYGCLRLRVKPIQDGENNFSFRQQERWGSWFYNLRIFEIDCSSRLLLTFRQRSMPNLEQLKVHFSSGLQIYGLACLWELKQVWLIGSCDEALKQDLERQLAEHPCGIKPVLKLEEASSR